jgi:hypothetical protein
MLKPIGEAAFVNAVGPSWQIVRSLSPRLRRIVIIKCVDQVIFLRCTVRQGPRAEFPTLCLVSES